MLTVLATLTEEEFRVVVLAALPIVTPPVLEPLPMKV
jgi:hypothetical protein